MKSLIETERLYLRELNENDVEDLALILCDADSMKYYPSAFSKERVEQWIKWNIENYKKYKHGLWAVILKENNQFIGDCGITIQNIEGRDVPEVGYHINKNYCNRGYATEASKACIQYGLNVLNYRELFTYTMVDNIPSIKVAEKNGMMFIKNFKKEVMGNIVEEVLYCIKKY